MFPAGAMLGSSFLIGPGRLGETRITPSIPLGTGVGVPVVFSTGKRITSAAAMKGKYLRATPADKLSPAGRRRASAAAITNCKASKLGW